MAGAHMHDKVEHVLLAHAIATGQRCEIHGVKLEQSRAKHIFTVTGFPSGASRSSIDPCSWTTPTSRSVHQATTTAGGERAVHDINSGQVLDGSAACFTRNLGPLEQTRSNICQALNQSRTG
jgi:hypothetical protein